MCGRGEFGQVGGEDRLQAVGEGQCVGGAVLSGCGVAADGAGEFDKGERVAGGLVEDAGAGASDGRFGLEVEEASGGGRKQRLDGQLPVFARELRGYRVVPGGEDHRDRFPFEAPGDEGEDVERAHVEPVGVVDREKQRRPVRRVGEQGEHDDLLTGRLVTVAGTSLGPIESASSRGDRGPRLSLSRTSSPAATKRTARARPRAPAPMMPMRMTCLPDSAERGYGGAT